MRINEALGRLVDTIYYKLSYIDSPKDDIAIKNLFKTDNQAKIWSLEMQENQTHLAVREAFEYINRTTQYIP
mgnify:CR=1 FL=1